MKRPIVIAAVYFALALSLSYFFTSRQNAVLIITAAFSAVGFAFYFVLTERLKEKTLKLIIISFIFGIFYWSAYEAIVYLPFCKYAESGHYMELESLETAYGRLIYGSVEARVRRIDGKTFFIQPKAIVYLKDASPDIKTGDIIKGRFMVKLPSADEEFDAYTYNKAKGIYLSASQSEDISCESPEKLSLLLFPRLIKQKISEVLNRIFDDYDAAQFSVGMLTGDTSRMRYTTKECVKSAGMFHLLSVSGMHISILCGVIIFVFGGRKGCAAAIPAILLIAAVSGFPASAVRAGIMNIILLIGNLIGEKSDGPSSLAFSAILILLFNPYSIFDVGFLLSFSASLGIMVYSPKISGKLCTEWRKKLEHSQIKLLKRLYRPFATMLSVSIAAAVFIFPVSAYSFKRISIVSVISGIFIMPVISAVFIMIISAAAVGFIYLPLGRFAARITEWAIRYILWVCGITSKLPFAYFSIRNIFMFGFTAALYAALLIYFFRKSSALRGRRIAAAGMVLYMLSVLLTLHINSSFSVFTVFDTYGIAAAAKKGNRCIIVNTGDGIINNSAYKIYEYLYENNITKASALVLTDIDNTHCGSAPELLCSGKIKTLYITCTYINDMSLYSEILEAAYCNNVEIIKGYTCITSGELIACIHKLTDGSSAAVLSNGQENMLIAYDINLFVADKYFKASDIEFKYLVTDIETISKSYIIEDFCRNYNVKYVVTPDSLFGEEDSSAVEYYLLSDIGTVNFKIKN